VGRKIRGTSLHSNFAPRPGFKHRPVASVGEQVFESTARDVEFFLLRRERMAGNSKCCSRSLFYLRMAAWLRKAMKSPLNLASFIPSTSSPPTCPSLANTAGGGRVFGYLSARSGDMVPIIARPGDEIVH